MCSLRCANFGCGVAYPWLIGLAVGSLIICIAHVAGAGPIDEGQAAYDRGDYSTALKIWRPLAEQGDARAQFDLGEMYRRGRGVPQDYVRAYMWFNLVASSQSGEIQKGAALSRDRLAGAMTHLQIAMARMMTTRCQELNYKQCDDLHQRGSATNAAPSGQTGAAPPSRKTVTAAPNSPSSSVESIRMQKQGDVYIVPGLVNNAIALNFVVDSGASYVSLPSDVVRRLMRTGSLRENDFLGTATFRLADGSTIPSSTFRIRSLKIGNRVVENVTGNVAPSAGSVLLGQSFLSRFKSWSIDNTKHVLVLE